MSPARSIPSTVASRAATARTCAFADNAIDEPYETGSTEEDKDPCGGSSSVPIIDQVISSNSTVGDRVLSEVGFGDGSRYAVGSGEGIVSVKPGAGVRYARDGVGAYVGRLIYPGSSKPVDVTLETPPRFLCATWVLDTTIVTRAKTKITARSRATLP
jgi:hypothetical protein